MSRNASLGRRGVIALLVFTLAGCATSGPDPASTSPPRSDHGDDEPRFLIQCFTAEGEDLSTFTRLEEAWASTNYPRIDNCEASVASTDGFRLSRAEEDVAKVAQAGLPDMELTGLFLLTLAACVRIAPEGAYGMANQPTSILEAAVVLCPEAPHAGLIDDELGRRE